MAYDEFPYGRTVELKRRMQTRAGDPLVKKLARDIHCLISVWRVPTLISIGYVEPFPSC